MPVSGGTLLRVLGLAFGIAVSVGGSIGSGILRFPGEVAARLPTPEWFLAVWIMGGLYTLVGLPSMAELGTMMPRAGGAYLYAQRALGRYAGFVVGWSGWVGGCASAAAVATILAEYLGGFSAAAARAPLLLSLLLLLPFPLLHCRGIHWGSGAQQLTTFLKLAAFTALIAACFLIPSGGPRPEASSQAVSGGGGLFLPLMLALQGVIFTYGGWQAPVGFSEELRHPERDIPRSMFCGVFLVISVYLLVNLALLHTLPLSRIAGQTLAVGAAAEAVFGPRGEQLVRGLAILSVLGVQNAGWLGLPRTLLAMGRDGIAPTRAASVNAGGTPAVALMLSAAVAGLFLLSGTFQSVLATTVLIGVSTDAICYLSVFLLRRREPNARRPYRAWGYPWTTGAALFIALALVFGVAVSTPVSGLWAVLLLTASYPATVSSIRGIAAARTVPSPSGRCARDTREVVARPVLCLRNTRDTHGPIERYEFDRQGFLVIPAMLTPEQAACLLAAVDALEEHALARLRTPPRKQSLWGPEYHLPRTGDTTPRRQRPRQDPDDRGLLQRRPGLRSAGGPSRDHGPHPQAMVQGPVRINNSEIRIRYTGQRPPAPTWAARSTTSTAMASTPAGSTA